MEVPLTPGTTAFLINLITDVLAVVALYGLIRSLNALGRRKLYQSGKVDINMHFRDMGFPSAFWYAFRLHKASRTVSVLLCFQATVSVITVILMIIAPIGLSESKNYRVDRNHTVQGDSLCRIDRQSFSDTRLGEAAERVKKHFQSGGSILSIGRTGRNDDALLVEDEQFSLGPTQVVDEFKVSVPMNMSPGEGTVVVDWNLDVFLGPSGFDTAGRGVAIFDKRTYVENKVIVEGPLYSIHLVDRLRSPPYDMGQYSFIRCDLAPQELVLVGAGGASKEVDVNCTVANLQRNVSLARTWETIPVHAEPPRQVDKTYPGLSLSEVGMRSIMVSDLAFVLSLNSCGDSYVAYLPLSEVSRSSIIVILTLGGITFVSVIAAGLSLLITRGTFNWNGSNQRVINLVASSESIEVKSCWHMGTASKADVVIEPTTENLERPTYNVHALPRGAASNPVPKANVKMIR